MELLKGCFIALVLFAIIDHKSHRMTVEAKIRAKKGQ